jgi:hypothetical protein
MATNRAAAGEVPFTKGGEGLLHVALPPGTPEQAQLAVRRLVELTAILARRCAQLQEALDSRVTIEQAKGVLAERFGLEPDQAFDVLRRSARSNRVPLRDLAERVTCSRSTPWEVAGQLNGAAAPSRLSAR